MSCRVALVDDDKGVLDVLRTCITSSPGFTCVGCYLDGESALSGIPSTRADVVLMDLKMPGMTGIECTERLKATQPQLPVVMLTGHAEPRFFFESLMAGASGYLIKPTSPKECVAAIIDVLNGGAPLSKEVAKILVSSYHQTERGDGSDLLTVREREIIGCLCRNFTDKEISKELGIAKATVHTHLHRIYEKLHAKNRSDAVKRYRKLSSYTSQDLQA